MHQSIDLFEKLQNLWFPPNYLWYDFFESKKKEKTILRHEFGYVLRNRAH